MIKVENRLAEKCRECPYFEETIDRENIHADRTVAATIISINCSHRLLCDSIERYLERREENKTCW